MNLSFPTKLEGKSAISVAFLFALAAPLAAEGPDPRQRTGPQTGDPAVLVTAPQEDLRDRAVSGGGETAVTCPCNANVNNDGFVNVIDEDIVLRCIRGDCSGCVNACDVNCDGAVDWVDMGIVRCQFRGISDCCNAANGACAGMNMWYGYEPCQVTTAGTCSWFGGTYLGNNTTCSGCVCNADVNNNGNINVLDAVCVGDCAEGLTCACCVNACDVDCDGTVDWADFGAVWCEFEGGSGCCDLSIGACDISRSGWPSCADTSQNACESNGGTYRGDGSSCAAPCGRTGDPPCPAGKFCEDPIGTCGSAPGGGQCTLIPTGCAPSTSPVCGCDGVTYANPCAARAAAVSVAQAGACPCEASRVLADATYCPGRVNVVRIVLTPSAGASSIAVADSPPTGWTAGAISNGGGYDAVNHKVKWFLPSPPFPAELTYEVTPNGVATGQLCFSGVISVDGVNSPTCGDDCLNYQCCPYITAETPQPICTACSAGNCSACTSGSCLDGSVSLCEIIAYGCAWVRGCNDDIAAVTRAAFIWRNGECYCWDDATQTFIPTACGGSTCCAAGPAATAETYSPAIGGAWVSVRRDGLRGGGLREWEVSIDVVPAVGTSAAAVEMIVPHGWKVIAVGENGEFDRENGKIKWGPYFGDAVRTLTATVRPGVGRNEAKVGLTMDAVRRGLRGTVSFDGVNSPVTITR